MFWIAAGLRSGRLEASWNCSVLPGTSKAVTLDAEAPRSVSKNRALRGSNVEEFQEQVGVLWR